MSVPLTEKVFAGIVHDLARQLGWRRYHTYRSKRSEPGFPDEVLVRDRVIYAELKTDTGRLSDAQQDWIRALEQAGAEVHVWRPSDLQEIAHTLARRTPTIRTQEDAA